MSEGKKNLGPSVIVNFDDKERPMFFVANYRHIRERFGHLQMFATMEKAGMKEGETMPLFAMWPDVEGVRVMGSTEEAMAMRDAIQANITGKAFCKNLKIVPVSIFKNRFMTECLFGEKWERNYWLHRRFQKWTSKGHFRKVTLLRLRETERVSRARRRCMKAKDGRYIPAEVF